MTATTVDPLLVAAINQLEVPCSVLDRDRQPCGDPAAWLVTWTSNLPPCRDHGPMPWCISHFAALQAHRAQCAPCRVAWDVKAEEI